MMSDSLSTFPRAGAAALPDNFQSLVEPHLHELLVHCYRFLGSLEDAEDALQETLLRAWRRLDSLKDAHALRAWLYRIATNVCLDALDRHKVRALARPGTPPANPTDPLPAPLLEPVWLGPLPDDFLDFHTLSPEAHVETRESVSLAFLAALQRLPGRQRAALILCDVLGWKAQETAELLEVSAAAVNSALQRARATLKLHQGKPAGSAAADSHTAVLLDRYVHAWEAADAPGLLSLLREDAVLTMPPLPAWYQGREAIIAFLAAHLFRGQAAGRFHLLATRANGCPALAVYQRAEDGHFYPSTLQVLALQDGQVARIDCFLVSDARLFARFGLPAVV